MLLPPLKLLGCLLKRGIAFVLLSLATMTLYAVGKALERLVRCGVLTGMVVIETQQGKSIQMMTTAAREELAPELQNFPMSFAML